MAEVKSTNGFSKWVIQVLFAALWLIMVSAISFSIKLAFNYGKQSYERHQLLTEKISGLNVRIATIEGNRFTSSDAQKLLQVMLNKLDKYPPAWLLEKVNKNEKDINIIEREIRFDKNNNFTR